jgi:hypothetical protein
MAKTDEVLETVERLLESVQRLERLYPGRRFTLDGHLVGSIGEVLAAELYGLELLPPSAETHDAVATDGRKVQIKLTQTNRVGLYEEPQHLVVLRLTPTAEVEEVFNGPGRTAWAIGGRRQKNGQRSVSLNRLRGLMEQVPASHRIAVLVERGWFRSAGRAGAAGRSR